MLQKWTRGLVIMQPEGSQVKNKFQTLSLSALIFVSFADTYDAELSRIWAFCARESSFDLPDRRRIAPIYRTGSQNLSVGSHKAKTHARLMF